MTTVSLNTYGASQYLAGTTYKIIEPATNTVIATASPRLDGRADFTNVPPGRYVLQTDFVNAFLPVDSRPIFVLPNGQTKIDLVLDPTKFPNSAIVDKPDVPLDPMITTAQGVSIKAMGLAVRKPGELFTAEHYNDLAAAVRILADVVASLAQAVTPIGHNHSEYENKLKEMATNFDALVTTLTNSTTQIQRRFEVQALRERVEDVFAVGNATVAATLRTDVLARLTALEAEVKAEATVFSAKMRAAASFIRTRLAAFVAAIPATSKPVVDAYHAVLNEWDNRFYSNSFDEVINVTALLPRDVLTISVPIENLASQSQS